MTEPTLDAESDGEGELLGEPQATSTLASATQAPIDRVRTALRNPQRVRWFPVLDIHSLDGRKRGYTRDTDAGAAAARPAGRK